MGSLNAHSGTRCNIVLIKVVAYVDPWYLSITLYRTVARDDVRTILGVDGMHDDIEKLCEKSCTVSLGLNTLVRNPNREAWSPANERANVETFWKTMFLQLKFPHLRLPLELNCWLRDCVRTVQARLARIPVLSCQDPR